MPIFLSVFLVIFALNLSALAASAQSDSESGLSVITYKASPEGFMSNSHIVMGENEAVLIDAQFSTEEGRKAAELIKSTGKKLSKILITHPHPDHYYGLEVLRIEFGDAVITGGPRTIAAVNNTLRYWPVPEGDTHPKDRITVMENGGFIIDDVDITYRVFNDGESIENTVIYIPSSMTLFTGDLASNGVHMWVGEGKIDRWLGQLRELRSVGPITTVYPGHGPVGSAEILEQAEEYLLNFKETVQNSETIEEAIIKMKKLYPQYQMPEILEGSVRAVMLSGNREQ